MRREDTAKRRVAHGIAVVAVALGGLVALPTSTAGIAHADSIYLTNGRVIYTASARIEGDRVIFRQYGGEISIPRSVVDRIVDDDRVERVTVRTARAGGAPREAAPADDAVAGDAATGGEAAAGEDAAAGQTPAADASVAAEEEAAEAPEIPGSTVEYWVERIRAVDERIARAEAELERLPAYSTAEQSMLRASGQARYFMTERQKWEQMLEGFRTTRNQLLQSARRAGISPGALRDGLRGGR